MTDTRFDRGFVLFLRLAMAWTFLYASSHQVFNPQFSVAGFLGSTKTFHALYAPLAAPAVAPFMTFLVGYGHLLIGLSLLFGLFTRLGAFFGALLMLIYWTAHMDFPYVGDQQLHPRLSHRLCGLPGVPDRQACRPRARHRRMGGEAGLLPHASRAEAARRLTIRLARHRRPGPARMARRAAGAAACRGAHHKSASGGFRDPAPRRGWADFPGSGASAGYPVRSPALPARFDRS
ncbi:DoxX family protein [Rhizobiales bacterium L72]|uniref:DoxX family protein n=1 Tax=Propylenella binzhouense TaxID=2555902 RepID=A0A964WU48_9HYPH|nr:DoxX family protein [Propylenella binzhouense]